MPLLEEDTVALELLAPLGEDTAVLELLALLEEETAVLELLALLEEDTAVALELLARLEEETVALGLLAPLELLAGVELLEGDALVGRMSSGCFAYRFSNAGLVVVKLPNLFLSPSVIDQLIRPQ